MPLNLNVNGNWKSMDTSTPGGVYVNVNGTWKVASEGWININGTWKKIFPEDSGGGGATGYYNSSVSKGITIKSNGSYYLIGGSFNVGGVNYAFAKSKSTFNPTYIVIHYEQNVISARGVWCTWSIDGITWYYEEVNATNWEFYGANLFGVWEGLVSNACCSLEWNGSTWVAGGWSDGTCDSIATSTNGTTWTGRGNYPLKVNSVGWNNNKWAVAGYENRIVVPYIEPNNISYSDDPYGTTWYPGVSPFTDFVSEITGNGAQWVAVGKDLGNHSRLKTSNTSNNWDTRYNSTSVLSTPVWDYLNNRWLIGSASNDLSDGGLKSSNGVSWDVIGMGGRYLLGRTFVINSNKYFYLGSKYDPVPNPNNTYRTIIAQRNNTDTSWTTVHEFPQLFSMGLGTSRKFATNNFSTPPQVITL